MPPTTPTRRPIRAPSIIGSDSGDISFVKAERSEEAVTETVHETFQFRNDALVAMLQAIEFEYAETGETTDYTVRDEDTIIVCTNTAPMTIYLPNASPVFGATKGRVVVIVGSQTSGADVTILGENGSADTIGGASSYALTGVGRCIILQTNTDANWAVIADIRATAEMDSSYWNVDGDTATAGAHDFSAATSVSVPIPTSSTHAARHTIVSANDPTVNDDSGDGYYVGQAWINTTSCAVFVLSDSTVGAAVWCNLSNKYQSQPIEWSEDGAGAPATTTASGDGLAFQLPGTGTAKNITARGGLPSGIVLTYDPYILVPFVVTATGTGTTAVLALKCRYIAEGELTTKAYDETVTVNCTITNTQDRLHYATFTLDAALMSALDHCTFLLERDPAHASDDYQGTVGILKMSRWYFFG